MTFTAGAAAFLVCTLTGLGFAQALPSCRVVAPASFQSIAEVNQFQRLQEKQVEAWAESIFKQYFSGHSRIEKHQLASCADVEGFDNILQQVFKAKTLDILRSAGGNKAKFAKMIERQPLPRFRMTGHFHNDPSVKGKAGFHRGHGSIFMNLDEILSNDWPVIFIHEFAHGLDSELVKALSVFANMEWIREFNHLGKSEPNFSRWPQDSQDRLRIWLRAGLERGYLAEYRAWTVTFALYEEGLQDGTFQRVAWLDEILRSKSPSQPMKEFVLNYFSNRFIDPDFGPLKYPAIQSELRRLRQEILASPPPMLGPALESVYSDK